MQAAALSHQALWPMDETAYAHIQREGYVVLRQVADPATVEALHADLAERFERTPFCTGDFYGFRTKRFGAVLEALRRCRPGYESRPFYISCMPAWRHFAIGSR
jgi:hypothetical protein